MQQAIQLLANKFTTTFKKDHLTIDLDYHGPKFSSIALTLIPGTTVSPISLPQH
jgi:hypothetical protein